MLHGGRRPFPQDVMARWMVLRATLGNGLLDLLILWRNERERPVLAGASRCVRVK
jgi:hypothetical protein